MNVENEAPRLQLPHTRGCLVCGRDNPHGLRLNLFVGPSDGVVRCDYVPAAAHVGFDGIVHGGALATVLDEAMVWAATWSMRRFCLCGEMTIRFRAPAGVGARLAIEARVESRRARVVTASGLVRDDAGRALVEASGRYVAVDPDAHRRFCATMLPAPATAIAMNHLQGG